MLMIVTAVVNAGDQHGIQLKEPDGVLSLIQALQLAYQYNPELAVYEGAIQAGEARIIQARLLPNPELSAEAENVWGRDAYQSFDGAESTLTIDQPLELGGKRSKRTSLADTERYLAEWDYKSQRLELAVEVTKSFIGVLAGQQRLKVKGEIVHVAENFAAAVTARVEAGKVSPIEQTSAEIRVANARNAMMQAEKRLQGERKRLATLWGNPDPIFTEAVGELEAITPPPLLEALVELLPQNPRLARWEMEAAQREARYALERSYRFPDLTLSGGLRYFSETDTGAFVVGLGIPLPIFNRNQGSIIEARLHQELVSEEKRVEEMRIQRDLADTYQVLKGTYETAVSLREQILPAAQSALQLVEEGYRQGKFGYLYVLEAQRTLFEAREQEVDTLAAFHTAMAMMEKLTGESISTLRAWKTEY